MVALSCMCVCVFEMQVLRCFGSMMTRPYFIAVPAMPDLLNISVYILSIWTDVRKSSIPTYYRITCIRYETIRRELNAWYSIRCNTSSIYPNTSNIHPYCLSISLFTTHSCECFFFSLKKEIASIPRTAAIFHNTVALLFLLWTATQHGKRHSFHLSFSVALQAWLVDAFTWHSH